MQTISIQPNSKFKTGWIFSLLTAGCFLLAVAWSSMVQAETTAISLNTWFVEMDRYEGAAHGNLECEECHGPMIGKIAGKSNNHPDPKAVDVLKNPARKNFDYQVCKNCHEIEFENFLKGEHAPAAFRKNEDGKPSATRIAPVCGDCHSAHYP